MEKLMELNKFMVKQLILLNLVRAGLYMPEDKYKALKKDIMMLLE